MSIIKIEHLTRDYGNNKGVFDVSFELEKGEIFGFLGPNGAGKTTTIRHLLGFLKPQKGSLSIMDYDCTKEADKIQRQLGYIPGEISFMDEMTGKEFIEFIARYRGMRGLGRAEELIQRFDLNTSGKIRKMSKGMKQKIAIVCAFMDSPSVIILDEPTSGLDPLMQKEFTDLLLEEKEKGATILMSSHIFEEVEKTCDRVGIIKDGKIVSIQKIDELQKKKKKMFEITFADKKEAEQFAKENVKVVECDGKKVRVVVQNNIAELIHILDSYRVVDMESVQQSLEEYFMHFYGGQEDDK